MSTYDANQQEKYYKLLDEVSVEGMDQDIDLNGIYYNENSKKKLGNKRVIQLSLAAIMSFIIFFVGGVTVSPTFANAVSQIPFLKPLVEMLAFDKGISDIIENEYIETMNVSQTIDGKTVTITGVVADESGMIIMYKFESDEDLSNFNGFHPNVLQGDDQISAGIGSGWYPQAQGTFELEDKVEITANPAMDYSIKDFTLILKNSLYPEIEFTLPFTLTRDIVQSKQFIINKDVMIDNQKITVHDLTISPLRSALRMSVDEQNSKKILSFSKIVIFDEAGEQWGTIRNGVTGWGSLNDDYFSLLFESNYFRTPESITIQFSEIEAVDKEDAYIEVDFSKNEILYQPQIVDIDFEIKDNYKIAYKYITNNSHIHRLILGDMIDSSEQRYHSTRSGISSEGNFIMAHQSYKVSNQHETPKNPVRIEISHYEAYLEGTAKLHVDLK